MTDTRIDGLRSIELGVHDLQKSAEFYRKVWALEDVAAEGDTIHLRGTGREHHVVTLRERPREERHPVDTSHTVWRSPALWAAAVKSA